MLIDFNPRLFGQLGFDAVRGLPSPYLIYLSASDRRDELREAVRAARAWHAPGRMVYANRTTIAWTSAANRLVGPRLSSAVDRQDASNGHPPACVLDAVHDASDPMPGLLDSVQQIAKVLAHPRSVIRAALRGF
jgi:D-aspartate ligase